ncbi:MAG: YajQ family cyclic di-GMP-binding protein [Chloroflexi bacterium]|jgi:uncharacterized protein YajQ (UPF0234 family)|nr:MAG: YajQ family cyclic di-GMP-binding protein [Chloroflexota bacterium]
MSSDNSFDVVSDFDRQELKNALDQTRREIATRYDFRGATAEIEEEKEELVIRVDGELRLKALRDMLESKAIKRGVDLRTFEWGKHEAAGGDTLRIHVKLRRGLDDATAKRIAKAVRESFPKVKTQIQGEAVRVSAKSRDDLQAVIDFLRSFEVDRPLQFENYR